MSRLEGVGCPGSVVVCGAGGRGQWSGAQAEELHAVERGREVGGPGPVGGETKPGAAAGAGDLAGGMEEAVAEPFGFGPGEVAVKGDEPTRSSRRSEVTESR
jgi:hypothetical protein